MGLGLQTMDTRRAMHCIFALAVALVLALGILPAIAQAPAEVLIRPVAVCPADDPQKRCYMAREDYEKLQQFHAERLRALEFAGNLIDSLQAQNADLLRKLSHFAMGCEKRSS